MSFVEMLVATGLSVITLSAVGAALEVAVRQQPRVNARADRIEEGRAALERMTRELRQTYSVNSAGSTSIDVMTYRRIGGATAEQRRVVYDCSTGSCLWQEGPEAGPLGTAQTIFTGVTNSDIFTYQPDALSPVYVRVKLRFNTKATSGDPQGDVTMSGGTELRNTQQES